MSDNDDTSVSQDAENAAAEAHDDLRAFADSLLAGGEGDGDGKSAPQSEAPKLAAAANGEPTTEAEPSELEKLIAAREAKAKERSSIIDGAEKERERILREAREEAERERDRERAAWRQELEAEKERLRSSFREKPLDRLRDLGVDPKRLLEDGLREDDPAYQRQRELERLLAEKDEKIAKIEKRIADWDKQTSEIKEREEASQREAGRKAVEARFLELAKGHAEHDHLRQLYGARDQSLVLSAHASAIELRDLIGRLPSTEEVVEYMVLEARKELANRSAEAKQTDRTDGNAPKVTAKQTTLGSKDASVRRASDGQNFSKLSEEEQREDLVALANEMLANS